VIIGWGMHYYIDLLFWRAILFISDINPSQLVEDDITVREDIYELEAPVINPLLTTENC
jgi:hypothetical protein